MWLVHAGNRVDADDRAEPRFPADRVPALADRLRRFLGEFRPTGVVSAAASGADLLMLDTARELQLPIHVVLPLPVDEFRRRSVDQGEEWTVRFDRVLAAASPPVVEDLSEHDDWYLRGNDLILRHTQSLAGTEVPLAAVVRPPPRPDQWSATDDFATKAAALGLPVIDLDPGVRVPKTAFVVMPFGVKPDRSRGDASINCDETFRKAIVPALEDADLDWTRADRAVESGIVHVSMFRDLAEADVVVADLTLENGNVLYELGIRHVAKPASTILLHRRGGRSLFDIRLLREIRYDLDGSAMTDAEAAAVIGPLSTALTESLREPTDPDSPVHILFDLGGEVSLVPRASSREVDRLSSAGHEIDRLERTAKVRRFTERDVTELQAIAQSLTTLDVDDSGRQAQWLRIGMLLREQAFYVQALEVFDRMSVTSSMPAFAEVRKEQALCHRRLSNESGPEWDRALELLEEAFSAEQLSADAYGIAGGLAKRTAEAALLADERSSAAVNFLRAVGYYEQGIELEPANYYLLLNAVTTHRLFGTVADRPDHIEAARELLPVARYHASRASDEVYAHASLGELAYVAFLFEGGVEHRRAAVDHYSRAMAAGPRPDEATAMKDQLRIYNLIDRDHQDLLGELVGLLGG